MPRTLREWEAFLSHRVFVMEEDLTLGLFCSLLREMWEDAQQAPRGGTEEALNHLSGGTDYAIVTRPGKKGERPC